MNHDFVRNLKNRCVTVVKDQVSKVKAIGAMVMCYGVLTPVTVKAADTWAEDSAGINTDGINIQDSIVDFVGGLGKVLGVIMAAVGVFVLVQAFRNEDVDGKHRAGLYLGIAAAMFGLKTILEAFLGA